LEQRIPRYLQQHLQQNGPLANDRDAARRQRQRV
jgi:hypothetical protein